MLGAAWPEPTTDLVPDAVEIDGARYRELRDAAARERAPAPPGPSLASREITLRPVDDGLVVRGTWTIEAPRPGWVMGILAGPAIEVELVTIGGRPAPVLRSPAGAFILAHVDGPTELQLLAFAPISAGEPVELELLPASRGRIVVDDPEKVPIPVDAQDGPTAGFASVDDAIWGGGRRVAFFVRRRGETTAVRGPLAEAHAAIGLTIGDAEIRGRARLRWEARRGSLDHLRATVRGLGDDLELSGDGIGAWSKTGDVVEIDLRSPVSGRVEVELGWSHATPPGGESELALPVLAPEAWHADATVQIARDGEIEVIPQLEDWEALAAAEIPEWGQGLVEGTATAAYRTPAADRGGALQLLRFVPVPGPPVVVDVAATTVAVTEEGRMLARAHYEVRNERASHLRITPPAGVHIIGARVAGETALPAADDDGSWLVPLKRSLETVGGLISFPVEVTLLGEQTPWTRRERRELALPVLDAPVATSRVTVYLPVDYTSRLDPGEGSVVDAFTEGEGITYGLGMGDAGVAAADAAFQDAVQAYLDNDFGRAQARLDELDRIGASNENTRRLQSNLEVVSDTPAATGNTTAAGNDAAPKEKSKDDRVLARRVRDQAKARAAEDFRRQSQLEEEAEELRIAGDFDEAEGKLTEAIGLGDKLAGLEQAESVEQEKRNIGLEASLSEVRSAKQRRAAITARAPRPAEPATTSAPAAVPEPVEGGASPVVDVVTVEGTSSDSAGISLAGTTGAEAQYFVEGSSMGAVRARPRFGARFRQRARGGRRSRGPAGPPAVSHDAVYDFDDDALDGELVEPDDITLDLRQSDQRNALPSPVATASALAVVVPAVGEAILYQELLLEAGQAPTVRIDARRRLRRRTRRH